MLPSFRFVFAAFAIALPATSQAQDVTVYGGVSLTSNYLASGVTQTDDGPALQGYVEFEASGFYAGVWASNVDFGDDDKVEIDLYLGYRGETAGGFSYDLSYARYYYNASGDCCGEVILALGLPLGDAASVTAEVGYDPEASTLGSSLSLDYALGEKLGLSATFGHSEANANNYWDIGGTYSLSDTVSVDLRYHDTSDGGSGIVAAISFDTELFSR